MQRRNLLTSKISYRAGNKPTAVLQNKINNTDPTRLIFTQAEIVQVLTKIKDISDKGHMTETEEGIQPSEVASHIAKLIDPRVTTIQEAYSEDRKTIEIEVTIDNKS